MFYIYIPPKDSSYVVNRKNNISLFDQLEQEISIFGQDNCIIMGDLNSHIKDNDLDYIENDTSLMDILPVS